MYKNDNYDYWNDNSNSKYNCDDKNTNNRYIYYNKNNYYFYDSNNIKKYIYMYIPLPLVEELIPSFPTKRAVGFI